ncbi:MAG TPA: hypothetical protein VJ023_08165, partial [Pyrinomonadaceae bacterium]|nr:hypothetical protein [Pyrinomonadaceae bacterium]
IWSLGVVLYELAAGRAPFDRTTASEVIALILEREPPPLTSHIREVPVELERIVSKALTKDREQRYQTAKDLLIDLQRLKHELELQATPEGSVPPVSVSAGSSGESLASTAHHPSSAEYIVSKIKMHKWGLAVSLIVGSLLVSATIGYLLLRSPSKPADRSQWVQITNLPDAVSQPALSSDGRMLTFIRGPDTFVAPGEIYVKMLPDGEPVQLTRDNSQKMSPVFSPDSSQIAYSVRGADNQWDTWLAPVLAGSPRLWLPNASGLVWSDKRKILFSEIKNNDIHMALVAADENRASGRDVYVPLSERGMAHRSYPSPDGKWVLAVEMDRALWLPCRLVPMDGSSSGRQVGPAGAGCTAAAWSPDGKWMYLNSAASGAFHIWRQRFPDGAPEQITSGPTEEEGIAMVPDGRSFITAVGLRQSSVWMHDSSGDRQISLEGYSYDPKLTPDGKRLCYRILKGASSLISDPSELRVVDLNSGRNEPLLPGFAVVGLPRHAYDISSDGQRIVVSALDHEGKSRLWLTPLSRLSPPRQIPNVQGGQPLFGPDGEIFFTAYDGASKFLYRVHEDGTGMRMVIEQPIALLQSISPDKQWVVVKLPGTEGSSTTAFPVQGGSPVKITAGGRITSGDPTVQWSPDGRHIFIPVPTALMADFSGKTYVVPLPRGQALPQVPVGGLRSEAEIAKLPGALLIDAPGVTPGSAPEVYAFLHVTVQRNLFRIPLP